MTPKERFLKTPYAKLFSDISAAEAFHWAADYALLEMQEQMPGASDPAKGWDAHSQMQGALKFRKILEMLAVPEPELPKAAQSIDYSIYERKRHS
jgi:hypothetical protein